MIGQKGILLIADGLGDRPINKFEGQTPLEYAKTPILNKLCSEAMTGLIHPYREGCRVGTDWGHLCLFGYDPEKYYTGRGAIECYSAGLEMLPGDIAFRGNLATIDQRFCVVDRRAGRVKESAEISELLSLVNGMMIDDCTFYVKQLTEHRLAVLMRGNGLEANLSDVDPGTACEGKLVQPPAVKGENIKTSNILWKFLLAVHDLWDKHPINQQRQDRGALPVNFILTRGAAAAMVLPPFADQFPNVRAAVIAGDQTIVGIGRMCGMTGYDQSKFTGGFVTDFRGKATLALEKLKENDLVIVHVKGTDLCGHDNKPEAKAKIIEEIDAMFGIWYQATQDQPLYLALTADHSTPCHLREHSADPVPTFLWGPHVRVDACSKCGERFMQNGALTGYTGAAFMRTMMDYLGFVRKHGA